MPKNVERTTEAPDDKLGQIAEWLTTTFDMVATSEVQMIVMLSDNEERKSMVVLSNYDSDGEAAGDMLQHLSAVFEANGRKLLVMPIGKG